MRSTSRLFLSAILFIVAAGIASAQNASAAPPPAAPAAAAPIAPPLARIAPPPAAASIMVVDPLATTKSQTRMGPGSWFFNGMVVVAMFGIMTMVRRRRLRSPTSIRDFTGAHDLKPVLVQRP